MSKFVIDIETNGLVNPDRIWVVVCKDIDTGEFSIFRNVTEDLNERKRLIDFHEGVVRTHGEYIGHNLVSFDWPVLVSTLELHPEVSSPVCLDTLIVSRLINFSRPEGHSIESYGEEFGLPKIKVPKDIFKCYSKDLEEYCKRDVEITHKVYLKYLKYIDYCKSLKFNPLEEEHLFQLNVNLINTNGFKFNLKKAESILKEVKDTLSILDADILLSFPPKEVLIREFVPKLTKFGTISRTSVPRSLHPNIHEYSAGQTYRHTRLVPFNPSSHKQIIEVLHEAGWKPEDKTKTHIDLERDINRQEHLPQKRRTLDLAAARVKLKKLEKYGWKINEQNLSSLPAEAPASARTLAKRILYESRRRTLVEWIGLCSPDGRIHGQIQGIGTWTHRTASQKPNMQNIPNEFDTEGRTKILGKEFRQLWQAPKNRLLIGVDAEGIQLRIFAHYVNDPELTDSLVRGKKSDGTDPHSLNKRVLGSVCQTRAAAKRFIYALFLGAGLSKLAAILATSEYEARGALDRIMDRYPGFLDLKTSIIPSDAKRGWFLGLDGRKVSIPGETAGERKHFAMSGYLQNGEAVVMKRATNRWIKELHDEIAVGKIKPVNIIHDEWQTEAPNNMEHAIRVAEIQCKALEAVGQELNLNCPLAGSFWNDDHNDYTIGTSWYQTH